MSSFDRLLAWVEDEPGVVGVVLSGSRGRGLGVAESDWDSYLIVEGTDDGIEDSAREVAGDDVDLSVIASDEFRSFAAPGTDREWDAYALVHATVVVDRLDGQIKALADAKETLPAGAAVAATRRALDACINALVRSAKGRRDERRDEATLDAAEGVAPFLEVMFASEGRIRPYNRYLCWELERHPLSESGVIGDEILRLVAGVLQDTDGATREMFRLMERRARDVGIHDIVTAWDEGSLSLIR